jgi:hypothetical protein
MQFSYYTITDGNQTTGNDYTYSFDANNAVYCSGVLDLKISQLNVNKYAFTRISSVEVFYLQYRR